MFKSFLPPDRFRVFVAIVLASWALAKWNDFWYATIFDDTIEKISGATIDEIIQASPFIGNLNFMSALLLTLLQVIGLFTILRLTKAREFLDTQIVALFCSMLLITPALANAVLYTGSNEVLWALDSLHFILGYAGVALIFWMFTPVRSPIMDEDFSEFEAAE